MSEQRLIDLEIKVSHQEVALEALQQLTYDQQKLIAKLERALEQLTKRLEGDGLEIGPANARPPHY